MAIRKINQISLSVLILGFFIFTSMTTRAHKLPPDLTRVVTEIRRMDTNITASGNAYSAEYLEHVTRSSNTDAQGIALNPSNVKRVKLKVNKEGKPVLVIKSCVSGRHCRRNRTRRTIVPLPPEVGPQAQWATINPENNHVYILDQLVLHELELPDMAGIAVWVSSYDLSQLELKTPIEFMTFAKSLDLTDADTTHDLFMRTEDTVIEVGFAIVPAPATDSQGIVAQAAVTGAILIQVIDTSQFIPPSPDPAGLTYLEDSNTLLATDSEVNEIPDLFTGVDVFEINPNQVPGVLVNTFTTSSFSGEPTGVTYNRFNQHLFISDDDRKEVFETDLNLNLIRQFDTTMFGSNDPEGIALDPEEPALYVLDGVNAEVYKLTPGSNGVFDGVPPAGDDLITSFDTCSLGVEDPEGIAFQAETGDLFIVGNTNPSAVCDPNDEHNAQVAQITTLGTLVRTIDISAPNPNPNNSGGLAVGPSSPSGEFRLYIAARGLDNNPHPTENDGLIYEFSVPGLGPGNTAPQVSAGPNQTITLPTDVIALDGTVTDDGLPNPGIVNTTWTQVSGVGTVNFGDANAVDTTATFSAEGTYVLRLAANDGALTASDDLMVIVNSEPSSENFGLEISSRSNRSRAQNLEGAVAIDNVCIFLTPIFPESDIDHVNFRLDGRFIKRESLAPYDLRGTRSRQRCRKLDTEDLRDGSHTVRAKIFFDSGETATVSAEFSVRNNNDDSDDDSGDDD